MILPAIVLVLIPATPEAAAFSQLPAESACEACFHQCEADRGAIERQLEISAGWRRTLLLERQCEAARLAAVWYACWWITWSRASPEQRDEWADVLAVQVGQDNFWRGEIPLPLSLR